MRLLAESLARSVDPAELAVWAVMLLGSAAVVAAIRRTEAAGGEAVPGRPWPVAEWSGLDVLFLCGLVIFSAGIFGLFPPADAALRTRLSAGAFGLLAGALAVVAFLRARGASWRSIGLSSFDPAGDLRLAVAGTILVVGPLLAVATALERLVPYDHPVVDAMAAGRGPLDVLAVVLAAVVAAPIAEELLFRRVILGWLDRRFPSPGGATAILSSGILFGLAHFGQGLAWLPLVVLGVVLGELARRRGTLLPAILLHALFNGVSVALLLLQPGGR